MDVKLTARYAALQGSYWMAFCAVFGYASVFLLSKNYTASSIGILIAWANVLAAVLQPWIASYADRTRRFTLKGLMLLVAVAGAAPLVLLVLFPGMGAVVGGLYIVVMAATSVMMPLVNSVSVYYMARGRQVNFGLARGIGSLSYAVVSYVLGFLVDRHGVEVVLAAALVFLVAMFLLLTTFRMGKDGRKDPGRQEEESGQEKGEGRHFASRYKRFFLMLVGVVLIFSFHNMVNTYLIQIMYMFGGSSKSMGVSLALAAVCELPAMLLFTKLLKRYPSHVLLKAAAAGFMVKALAIFLAQSVMMVHLSQLLQGVSFALFIPASVYYANEIMTAKDKVKGQAFMTASITAGSVVGNLAGGKIIDQFGVPAMLWACMACAALGMAIVFFTASPTPLKEGGRA